MKKHFAPVLAVATLGLCALLLADVKTDYNHATDFGKYKTYSWIKIQAGDQLWQDRIKEDIDGQLSAKEWRSVPSGGDASLSAFGSTKEQQTLNTFYDGLGGGWLWRGMGGGMATTTVENTPVGTLVVDIFDSNTKRLIWRAQSVNTLSEKSEQNTKKLESTVHDMFKNLPASAERFEGWVYPQSRSGTDRTS